MGLIGMKKAWENTTGGLTPAGDTIVVAVLEKGMQKEHPDLIPNWWRNYKEVPDNGLDDDNNGYIDDYIGWDAAGVVSGLDKMLPIYYQVRGWDEEGRIKPETRKRLGL